MRKDSDFDTLVREAQGGSRQALEEIVKGIQDRVYGLALRMLWHPEDAKDATQEILIKAVTRLGSFKGQSGFSTWVYRVAANHLLNLKKGRMERKTVSFEDFGQDLATGLSDAESAGVPAPDHDLLLEEVKIGCTLGMLLCLDRPQRIAYILGEVFGLASPEASEILQIPAETFRKRLSRARKALQDFMRSHCGIINPANSCRCAKRIKPAMERGRLDAKNLLFAGSGMKLAQGDTVAARVREMERLEEVGTLYRSHPNYAAPESLVKSVRNLLASSDFRLL